MATSRKVLLVATSHDKLGNTDKPTGAWMEEIAAPYYLLQHDGYEVVIASPAGGKVPIDAGSMEDSFLTIHSKSFLADGDAMGRLQSSLRLADAVPDEYSGLFIAGGHGIAYDGPTNADLKRIVEHLFGVGRVVAAVCHGPNGLVEAHGPDGKPIVNGIKVTGFSNTEEEEVGKSDVVPFLLEDKLKELGGTYQKGGNWQEFVCVDGNLVTGQNPTSSAKVAQEMAKLMNAAAEPVQI